MCLCFRNVIVALLTKQLVYIDNCPSLVGKGENKQKGIFKGTDIFAGKYNLADIFSPCEGSN